MKMTYDDFEVGKYYLVGKNEVYLCCLNENAIKGIVRITDGGHYLLNTFLQFSYNSFKYAKECDRDGNLITPEPKVGQIWKDNVDTEYRIQEVAKPCGDLLYVGVPDYGCSLKEYDSIEECASGLTYVRG